MDNIDHEDLAGDSVGLNRQDLATLRVRPDICSYMSNYFQLCQEHYERLILQSKAYCERALDERKARVEESPE